MKLYHTGLLVSAICALTACGGSDDAAAIKETGKLSIALSDSPMGNVSAVRLQLGQLVMTDANHAEHRYTLQNTLINLLDYQGKASIPLLQNFDLPVGQYHNVYLSVMQGDGNNGCYVIDGQGQHALQVEDGVIPLPNFTMQRDQTHAYTLEVSLYQGLQYRQQNGYQLAQSGIRSVNNLQMGHLLGDMDPQWIASCEAANPNAVAPSGNFVHLAYLYPATVSAINQMADVSTTTPSGMTAPIAVAPLHQDDDGNWYFGMGYLDEGDYRVGYSCTGYLDDPLTDDVSSGVFNIFADAGSVSVTAGVGGGSDTYLQCGNIPSGRGHWHGGGG
ncbi:DUF4382 domain-containing protein [Shewanella avicenniae]|uniref:DUF4382 domain-containing protein n=1 Tax=Shewanella avicenniae TaxID=2814294 RepID=A0ABX7QSX9_9GAMM|nr:DUF4382 domain-containing protein [Shewanella avicenniae]QSX34354.1 DUF4382 domain-containing protein [Shewanella avicenniae]